MFAILLFGTQFTLSIVSFGLIAYWIIYPRLRERSLREALTLLLLFETFRSVGLLFLAPGLGVSALPATFTIPGAIGDMLAVFLAFVALVAVRSGWRFAPALVWLFTLEGLLDFSNAIGQGLWINMPANYHLGIVWLIPTYGVPAFLVAQLLIIALLLNRKRQRDVKQATDVPVLLDERV